MREITYEIAALENMRDSTRALPTTPDFAAWLRSWIQDEPPFGFERLVEDEILPSLQDDLPTAQEAGAIVATFRDKANASIAKRFPRIPEDQCAALADQIVRNLLKAGEQQAVPKRPSKRAPRKKSGARGEGESP